MRGLEIFEELRFIIELLTAEQIFVYHFARRKRYFALKNSVGSILLCLISVLYVPLIKMLGEKDTFVQMMFSCIWYIALLMLTLVLLKISYEITYADVLFMGIAGYTLQHIEYIVMNEVIAMGIFPSVTKRFLLYLTLCVASCTLLYWVVAKVFVEKLKSCNGIIYEDTWAMILYFLILLTILLFSSFICQSLFRNVKLEGVNYLGAATDFFSCTLILVIQYTVFRISTLNKEKAIVNQLLYERKKQYELSRENIEIINHKCHDLKHQIQALREAKAEELEQYIDEVEESVIFYDSVVKTENEVLNTILSEKSLYCEKHKIKLSCIVDSAHLDFMSTMDIYALLGNALDNAIECVSKYKSEEKRVVSLTISAQGSFLCIQTNNYFDGELKFQDGLPLSTKRRNRAYHGFGMKSMKHLAEKYGGALYTSLENGIFMLQVVIPMPKEFLRLLKLEQGEE